MKYNIFDFDQEIAISLIKEEVDEKGKSIIYKLDVVDLLLLHTIADYMNRKSIEKMIINDKIYFWISYNIIISDLPIIDIKKQALSDRLNKLAKLNLLEKEIVRNSQGTYSCFRIGEEYEVLKYKGGCSKIQKGGVLNYKPKDYSTNNNKEIKDLSISKKNDSFNFKQELLKLGVSEDVATDWMKIRKKAANSERAFNHIKHEIELTGASANDCITLCADKGWLGFEAEWFFKIKGKSMSAYDVNKEKDNNKEIYISLWKTDFNAYKQLVLEASKRLKDDLEFKASQEKYFPNINYELSIDKGCDYWISEQGYKKAKSTKGVLNMYSRLKNNFDKNKIYYSKGQKREEPIKVIENALLKTMNSDGELSDGTRVINGYRQYYSGRWNRVINIPLEAPEKPRSRTIEYDKDLKDWYEP